MQNTENITEALTESTVQDDKTKGIYVSALERWCRCVISRQWHATKQLCSHFTACHLILHRHWQLVEDSSTFSSIFALSQLQLLLFIHSIVEVSFINAIVTDRPEMTHRFILFTLTHRAPALQSIMGRHRCGWADVGVRITMRWTLMRYAFHDYLRFAVVIYLRWWCLWAHRCHPAISNVTTHPTGTQVELRLMRWIPQKRQAILLVSCTCGIVNKENNIPEVFLLGFTSILDTCSCHKYWSSKSYHKNPWKID